MRAVTPDQMKEIDKTAINDFGIPGMVLMENAALGVVREISKILGTDPGCMASSAAKRNEPSKKVIILAGKGNNGGDAFAVARHLFNMGASVSVYVLSKLVDITGDAKTNLDILVKMGIEINEVTRDEQIDEVKKRVELADIVVDGLLGTGLKGEVKGIMACVIELVNDCHVPVIAIDIPSGVNGETGKVSSSCIKACTTVTFGFPKIGQLIHPGCDYVGDLKIVDIGIPKAAVDNIKIKGHLIDMEFVSQLIPRRRRDSNKGTYGKILVVAGSRGMTGAACLTGGAALRSGAGLVYLAAPLSLVPVYAGALVEAVTIPFEDENKGYLPRQSISGILEQLNNVNVAAVGPGLSAGNEIADVVYNIIKGSRVPIVLDADGINLVAKDLSVLKDIRTQIVMTPHPGEMARLIGTSVKEVQKDRVNIARNFSKEWGVITVLKGSRTIIASPEGEIYINTTGNPGMSTGGSGDVLTGIIAGLIGQGLKPLDASIAGVYLHGACGDNIAAEKGEHGLIAGDLVREIPNQIKILQLP
ncbi:bifunctional ADP-dependent NAD(P)H-hydrate dehydratase/NAD(P)H-hydrate epimerase [Acetivibrio cellulolyticus]|uniref:bifunctional ADP-dependent NAD(P)H-hydrate dehydratase/NAD(P)H-hydrate epimerase n=1 Tax=Acetivibrio cellulolyticus TaxID=35830 RepID=UPI0001E2D534|nr:bifunctional ADP-dependent NAD(P)H-hydrate dehydratase/NAD(P)H-hydrate epimerase [Acetivibrio cellulolyticus]